MSQPINPNAPDISHLKFEPNGLAAGIFDWELFQKFEPNSARTALTSNSGMTSRGNPAQFQNDAKFYMFAAPEQRLQAQQYLQSTAQLSDRFETIFYPARNPRASEAGLRICAPQMLNDIPQRGDIFYLTNDNQHFERACTTISSTSNAPIFPDHRFIPVLIKGNAKATPQLLNNTGLIARTQQLSIMMPKLIFAAARFILPVFIGFCCIAIIGTFATKMLSKSEIS